MAARLPLVLLFATLAAGPVAAQPRLEPYGDPLPVGALYRIGTTRLQLGASVHGVALAPDGALVAAVSNGWFALWDAANGRELFRAPNLRRGSLRQCIVWARDGTSFVVNYDWQLCVFDVPSRKIRERLGGEALCAAFSRDGRTLTVVQRDEGQRAPSVRRWDVATSKALTQWPYPLEPKAKIDWIHEPWLSPDGTQLVALRTDRMTKTQIVRIRDAATGAELHRWPLPDPPAYAAAFSPDGKLVAATSLDKTFRVLEMATAKERFRCKPEQPVNPRLARWYGVCFAPDGASLLSGGQDDLIRWDAATGKEMQRYPEVWGPAAFSADGKKIAAAGPHSAIRLLDAATGKDLCPLPRPGPHAEFSPDGRRLVWSDRGAIVLGDARTGKEERRWDAQAAHDSPLAFAPDGKLLASLSKDRRICLWTMPSGRALRTIATKRSIDQLFFTADGRRIVSRGLEWDSAWDPRTGERREPWAEGGNGIIARAAHADLVYVRQPSGGFLQVVDPTTGKVRHQAPDYAGTVYAVLRLPRSNMLLNRHFVPQFSPDRRLLLVTDHLPDAPKVGGVFLWDLKAGKRLPSVLLGSELILDNRHLTFSPDGRLLAHVRSNGQMALMNTATGDVVRQLGTMSDDMSPPPIFAFTPDGRTLVSGQNGLVQFWEVASGGEIARRVAHADGIRSVIVSPDGRTLATTADDQPMLVWDLTHLADAPVAAVTIESLWDDLAHPQAAQAQRAVEALIAAHGKAVALLGERLKPIAGADPKQLARWIDGLGSDEFTERDRAQGKLDRLGELAMAELERAMADHRPIEARRRIEALLRKVALQKLTPAQLQSVRAVQVLESIDNAEARHLLQELARGAAGARLTEEAKAVLARLR